MVVSPNELAGVSASPGLAVGQIVHYRQDAIEVAETGGSVAHERSHFESALHDANKQIEELRQKLSTSERDLVQYANAKGILVLESGGKEKGPETAAHTTSA